MNTDLTHAVRTAEEDAGVIYLAVNIFNWKCYIGWTLDFKRRKAEHLVRNDGTHFHNAIQYWGTGAFLWVILSDGIPLEEFPQHEQEARLKTAPTE